MTQRMLICTTLCLVTTCVWKITLAFQVPSRFPSPWGQQHCKKTSMVDINGPTSCLIRGKELLANPHDQDDLDSGKSPVELEMEELQERYALIEALEARNEAQLESFVDERDQWESLEPEERELLQSKEILESRMEILTEQLVQLWMGQKSMEG